MRMRPKVDGDEMDLEVLSDLLIKRLPTGIRGLALKRVKQNKNKILFRYRHHTM